MATCIGCGLEVGCGCSLQGGLCGTCLARIQQQNKLCYTQKYQIVKSALISFP